MPAVRGLQIRQYQYSPVGKATSRTNTIPQPSRPPVVVASTDEAVDLAKCDVVYPVDEEKRRDFLTTQGKKITPHQWAVYDHVRQIPVGKVTTYKDVCLALGEGSPRSVGSALRNNPFAPFIPCHRIIASNHFIGGFYGEWGQNSKTGEKFHDKLNMLAQEGVGFTENGYLMGGDKMLWRG
ncbi:6-O-methylguanine DNA methyltransferase [Hysterangium stoloniferum]|nr:6-O-methylguanine DNA methyltransferase [Hysterangium stoloniferum]